MKKLGIKFMKDESGVTSIEYALVAALIVLASIVILGNVGSNVANVFTKINTKLAEAVK